MNHKDIGIILDALTWTHAAICRVEGTQSEYRLMAPTVTISKLHDAIPIARRLAQRTRESAMRRKAERLAIMGIAVVAFLMSFTVAQADDRHRERHERHESHNYIIERQQAYQVRGVPTSRIINGKREIDVYPNGLMFEKNNVVGVAR